jgi:hypothetical protein
VYLMALSTTISKNQPNVDPEINIVAINCTKPNPNKIKTITKI